MGRCVGEGLGGGVGGGYLRESVGLICDVV